VLYFLYASKKDDRQFLEAFRGGLDFFYLEIAPPHAPSRRSQENLKGQKCFGPLEKPLKMDEMFFSCIKNILPHN
jgi:hypothetical protein